MELKENISRWVDAHERELMRDIARLVAVRSVRGEAAPGAPFGPGPRAALDEALAMCSEYGFRTQNFSGAVGAADLNALPARVDILGHLDVVDEGEGWSSDPYACVERDGCLYGRGTDDDKGPIVMALHAMRCVRELGLPLSGNVRLIMGTNEEDGSADLPYYYNHNSPAPCTFTPDSGFPLINVERGPYRPEFTMSWPESGALPRVSSLEGGFRLNVIPADAQALIAGMDPPELLALAAPEAEKLGVTLRVKEAEGGALISVHGAQAHAASPEDGNNGVTALLSLLSALPLAPCPSTRALRALSELFPHGDFSGKALGIAQKDEVSGALTLSFTLLSVTETGLSGRFDSRVPACANDENCRLVTEKALGERGFSVAGDMAPVHHTPAEGEFIRTLLSCYETYSGRKGECIAIGGGTYVHDIPGGVAFGAGMPDFDSRLHGADERINVADSLTAVKIFALAIAELCGKR